MTLHPKITFASFHLPALALGAVALIALAAPGCEEGEGDEDGGPLAPSGTCTNERAPNIEEGPTMAPGGACISCHSQGEGPSFTIAGTVMPGAHDGDVCQGVSGVTVVITDADGKVIELTTNSVGNFSYEGPVAKPFSAKVVSADGENAMMAEQTNGDCNSCHTEEGASNAPGRILPP